MFWCSRPLLVAFPRCKALKEKLELSPEGAQGNATPINNISLRRPFDPCGCGIVARSRGEGLFISSASKPFCGSLRQLPRSRAGNCVLLGRHTRYYSAPAVCDHALCGSLRRRITTACRPAKPARAIARCKAQP